MKKLYILIPAYNEAKSIGNLIDSIPSVAGTLINIIVVDDGSNDKTGELAKKAGALVLKHNENRGLAVTFLKGLQYCVHDRADFILILDADSQYHPNQIPSIMQPLLEGKCQLSMGNRFFKESYYQTGFITKLTNYLISFIISRVITKRGSLYDVQSSFRGFTRELGKYILKNLRGDYNYSQEFFILTSLKGFPISQIPVKCLERKFGKSRLIKYPIIHVFKISKISIETWLRCWLKI